jgi:hypothetical protein
MKTKGHHFLSVLLITLALSGCAGMSDSIDKMAGLGVVTQSKSTFDGSTTVEVSPTWLLEYADTAPNSVKLGARWSSASPKYAALILSYGSDVSGYKSAYLNLTGLDVNVDGKKVSFAAGKPTDFDSGAYNSVSQTIYTKSENTVIVPLSLLERMAAAKDCRIRVHTNKGYEDSKFSIERSSAGQKAAILPIREFLNRVRSVRASLE